MSAANQSLPPLMDRALVPFRPVRAFRPRAARAAVRYGLMAAAGALLLGLGAAGYGGARQAVAAWTAHGKASAADPQALALGRLQSEVGRLQASIDALRSAAEAPRPDEQLRSLKRSVDALKQNVEQAQSADTANVAELAARLDKADRDPSPRLAEIAARLDRIEKQVVVPARPAPAPAVAPAAPPARPTVAEAPPAAQPAAAPSAPRPVAADEVPTPPAKPATVAATPARPAEAAPAATTVAKAVPPPPPPPGAGGVLRDVYDGMALVESRGGGLREVEPGQYLPGAGEVRAIERHGRSWVLLTSRGVIEASAY